MYVCEWDDEETTDNLLWSGASAYPWWHDFSLTEDGQGVVFIAEDPDTEWWSTVKIVSLARLREVTAQVANDQYGANDRIRGYILDDDIDAEAADCILQAAVYGMVVFG
jgi:hypothetical protein